MDKKGPSSPFVFPKGWARWWFIPALILVAIFATTSTNVLAVHDQGLFQLDRNAVDDGAGDDWANVYNNSDSSLDDTGILPDIGAGGGTQFHGGGSKDDLNITQWLWKDGEPLDKDDITNAYAAAYEATIDTGVTNIGDLLIYFGLDRFDTSGSAQVGFWFLQDPTFGLSNTKSQGGLKFNGAHVNNDVLVQSNFSNGGVISSLSVYKWLNGALVPVFTSADCVGPPVVGADDPACATVNRTDGVVSPWPYTDKDGLHTFQASAFFEGGINITRLIPAAGCFNTFLAETRSSTPFDAVLKDFVIGDLDTCAPDVKVTKTADVDPINAGDTASFTILVEASEQAPRTVSLLPITCQMGSTGARTAHNAQSFRTSAQPVRS